MEFDMANTLVVIGNGMAGMRTVEELLKIAPKKYNITVFGAEPYGNYNRIMLSPVLTGEKTIEQIMINDRPWYEENNIILHAGANKEVVNIDRRKKTVTAMDGTSVNYDRLLFATGSNPFIIPFPGHDLHGVIAFRDIADVDTMIEVAKTKRHAIVIGGGLLGLEAANGLMKQGMDVTVIHDLQVLMNRQLDPPSAKMLEVSLEERGLSFKMAAKIKAILGDESGNVTSISFEEGEDLPADLIVMAVGVRPNIALAKKVGLQCNRGIFVNDTMQTYDPRIYAVGECVEHRGDTFGLVAPLFEQAKVCANHLAEYGIANYRSSAVATKLKVTGVNLFSAGDFTSNENSEDIIFQDPKRGVYKKVVIEDDNIKGAVLYGDTIDGSWYFQMMKDGTNISEIRDRLLYGQAHLGDSGTQGANAVSNLPDNAEICGCNGVCKSDIVNAIASKSLFTLDDVRDATKASASCGSCTGLVEQLIADALGSDFNETETRKSICRCTDYSHDEIRTAISTNALMSFQAVSQHFSFSSPDGCHVCRPAINYYLLAHWPGVYEDDSRSRFINERTHANIQKDNTYSVVPRMWGGLTTPAELRAIADAAEKYNVPTVKVTGGQRIDLLGVKKEDLPNIWKDLNDAGMVSGHAYGKSLRTVKTCVGSTHCRFGTQDSMGMGIEIEKMTWGSWTPAKVKIAVSGCPRNCAEATIKDFGVVAVDSGWELYVGGNGGMKVRVSDFLTKVSTEAEVIEYAGAFMQMYREQGHHNERSAPWIERVGLNYIKEELIENDEKRKGFHSRFLESQKYAQDDPWAERASKGVDVIDFIPLKVIN
ncbi:nitrite reductase large subunit [Gammaproteobacteria bacterium 42_54_T18]|nr:nitrite reductase large subunit [Gammaproteobacteria bacterium 42_54_T18]